MATEFLTRKETANRLDVSPRHISRLKEDGVLTTLQLEGERWPKYPWPHVKQEFDEYRAKLEGIGEEETEEELLGRARGDPKRRQEMAKARMAELELLEKMGELMPRSTHRKIVGELLDLVQAQSTSIPGRWSSDIIGIRTKKEAVQVLRDLMNEHLEDLRSSVSDKVRRNGTKPE